MGFQEKETPGVHHPEHVFPFSLPAPALGSAWAHSPSYLIKYWFYEIKISCSGHHDQQQYPQIACDQGWHA